VMALSAPIGQQGRGVLATDPLPSPGFKQALSN
jgi:hypothetical protein